MHDIVRRRDSGLRFTDEETTLLDDETGAIVVPSRGAWPAAWDGETLSANLALLAADAAPSGAERRVLVFAGHCRWGRGQLAREFVEGSWGACVATAADVRTAAALGEQESEDMWRMLRESGRLEHYADWD